MDIEKNIAIVCNPKAGVGVASKLSDRISLFLKDAAIKHTIFKTEWPEHFGLFSDVFISGGDGTLNYFFNKYPGIQKPITLFNGGTGNDFFSLLYKNKTFEELIYTGLNEVPKLVDAGKCNERYFINGAGIGFDGAISKAMIGKKKKPGKTSFMTAILKKIFFYSSKTYTITSDEYSGTGKNLLINVMNGNRAGGGFYVSPLSIIDDGYFDVIVVDKLHPFLRLRWLPVIEKGKHLNLSFIKYFKAKKIIITSSQTLQTHLDGEYMEANRLEIEILPAKFLFRY